MTRKTDFQKQKSNILQFLKPDCRVLNYTHIDLDGIGCTIALSKRLNNITKVEVNYYDVADRVRDYDYSQFDVVIFSDIYPSKQVLDYLSNSKVIVLDHHETAREFHDPENFVFIYTDVCGSKICHEFIKTVFGESRKSTEVDELIEIINDYDMWIHKDPRSNFFNWLYVMYKSDGFKNRFEYGDLKLLHSEKEYLAKKTDEIRTQFNNTELFDFKTVNGCMFFNDGFINDIADMTLKKYGFDFIITVKSTNLQASVRSTKYLDVGKMLKELGIGGGHKNAAGFWNTTNEILQKNLQDIEKYVYLNYEYTRK